MIKVTQLIDLEFLVHIYGKTDLNLNKNCGKSFMIHKNYQVMDADEEFTLTMVMIKIE